MLLFIDVFSKQRNHLALLGHRIQSNKKHLDYIIILL